MLLYTRILLLFVMRIELKYIKYSENCLASGKLFLSMSHFLLIKPVPLSANGKQMLLSVHVSFASINIVVINFPNSIGYSHSIDWEN